MPVLPVEFSTRAAQWLPGAQLQRSRLQRTKVTSYNPTVKDTSDCHISQLANIKSAHKLTDSQRPHVKFSSPSDPHSTLHCS